MSIPPFVRLDGAAVTLVLATAGGPMALYWGPRLPAGIDPAALVRLGHRGPAPASPAVPPPLSLTPQAGDGWPGRPGLAAHRAGQGWASLCRLEDVQATSTTAVFLSRDAGNGLVLVHELAISGDVLVATTRLSNAGTDALAVEALAAPVLPIPGFVTDLIGFDGRWAG